MGIDNDKIGVLEIIISTINNYFRMTPPPPGCWLRGQDVRSRLSLVTSPVTNWNISTTHNPRTVPGGDGGAGAGEDVVTLIAGFRCNRRQDIQLKISRLPRIGVINN